MNHNVHHRYVRRQRHAAQLILANPRIPVANTLNSIVHTRELDEQTPDLISRLALHHLGISGADELQNADHETAARLLRNQDQSIMANYHATMMSSLWAYFQMPHQHHNDFYSDLAKLARRITWLGQPYIPADRWEMPDGSAIVVYGASISMAVHRERLHLISDAYVDAAQKSFRRITAQSRMKRNYRGTIPLVPNPAFAPASDGILSHQAALPLQFDHCWCQYRHQLTSDPNQVMP